MLSFSRARGIFATGRLISDAQHRTIKLLDKISNAFILGATVRVFDSAGSGDINKFKSALNMVHPWCDKAHLKGDWYQWALSEVDRHERLDMRHLIEKHPGFISIATTPVEVEAVHDNQPAKNSF